MDIIEPHLPRVVPLFRALHAYHAGLEPEVFHCGGTDGDYLSHLEEKCANGGRIFAHDAGWGLVSYLLALPIVTRPDALRLGNRTVQVDHLYVSPELRGAGLAQSLVRRVERWVHELGFDGWFVTYHSANPGAADVYAKMGAHPYKGVRLKRLS